MAATDEVNKPPSLPDYPEMILAAIESLNEKEGSNKSAISNYISSTYGGDGDRDLPEVHSTLLTTHLNKMKESGELVMVKNNYMRPNPEAPPKRGRGRPPKPKLPVPADAVVAPPRPRGRPPKPKDPLAVTASPPMKKPASTGRPRGRPPKATTATATAPAPAPAPTAPAVASTGPPRPRGRPPKVKPAQLAAVGV